ncbi:MAG: hypothetical protein ACK5XO_04520, partial [Phycisphaerales bacterium]
MSTRPENPPRNARTRHGRPKDVTSGTEMLIRLSEKARSRIKKARSIFKKVCSKIKKLCSILNMARSKIKQVCSIFKKARRKIKKLCSIFKKVCSFGAPSGDKPLRIAALIRENTDPIPDCTRKSRVMPRHRLLRADDR